MFDKYMKWLTAAIFTIMSALLLWILAVLAYGLHKELTSGSQSNQPAKVEVCK